MESHLISYYTLRRTLGLLGIFLPILLPLGVYLFGKDLQVIQNSISHYYYTNMSDIFVGVLWAFGLFLFTYKGYKTSGYRLSDNLLTNTAGVLAIGVAIFPTGNDAISYNPGWVGVVHLICAATFFVILGGMSIFIFTQGKSRASNRLYVILGIVMWTCLLVLLIYFLTNDSWTFWPAWTVYFFEAIMLFAFGFSWLTKGKGLRFMGLT